MATTINIACYEFREGLITQIGENSTPWANLIKKFVLNKCIYRERTIEQNSFAYKYKITDEEPLIKDNPEEIYIGRKNLFKLNLNLESPDAILVFTRSDRGEFKNDLKLYNKKSSYFGALQNFRCNGCGEAEGDQTPDTSVRSSIVNYAKQVPIITLCPTNIIADNSEEIDKRIKFLDGSIWHRFIHLSAGNTDWEEDLAEVIWDICYWKGKIENGNTRNFYEDVGAREYLEYSLRLLANSWIDPKATATEMSGHSTHVNPFIFHSEKRFKEVTKKIIVKFNNNSKTKSIGWNIALLDDKDERVNILCSVLERFSKVSVNRVDHKEAEEKGSGDVYVKYPEIEFKIFHFKKLSDLANFYKNPPTDRKIMFDIFLLDYLLEEDADLKTRKLGIEILTLIEQEEEKKEEERIFLKNRGPFNRFWFFPSSVFNDAFHNAIKEKSINPINEKFYLHYGEDMINKPMAFAYNLLRFMETQVREAHLDPNELKSHLNEFISSITPADRGWSNVESEARAAVNRFMYRFGTFEMLDYDEKKGSLLAKSLKDINDSRNVFLYNSIRDVLYLIGYRSYSNLLELLNAAETINTAVGRIGNGPEKGSAAEDGSTSNLLETIKKRYQQET